MNFRSFKIMPRRQDAHAIVNAAFLLSVDSKCVVRDRPRLVFGGISKTFARAERCEAALAGKDLSDEATLRQALTALRDECVPDAHPISADAGYRRHLALALFYKVRAN